MEHYNIKKAFTLAGVFYPLRRSKKIASRIIRDLAGVTSGSTRRAGFAFAHTAPYRKFGFTLAEVLITLGIIGVVAALTLPALMVQHEKRVTQTKLKNFYSKINEALKLSELENGPVGEWTLYDPEKFYDQYLDKYLKDVDREYCTNFAGVRFFVVIFPDGSAMGLRKKDGYDIEYYINYKKYKIDNFKRGRNVFCFNLLNTGTNGIKTYIEPYTWRWNGTEAHLKSNSEYGCHEKSVNRAYCTKLIQINGWNFPKDYPIKF